jgi:hypothetical protein
VVDEDGVGGGIVDNLRGVKGFVNNSSPIKLEDKSKPQGEKKDNYRNLKTQCSYMLADKVNNHKITISATLTETEKDQLVEELGQIRRKITDDHTTLQIIGKEEVKENLGRSPDLSDAMMMRMIFDLEKPKHYIPPPPELGYGGVNPFPI